MAENMHRLGRNVLILLLTWAQNPSVASCRILRRDPIIVYLSRNRLLADFSARTTNSGGGLDR
jgi:hypothetical protein